jgi:membrane protein
MMGIGELSHFIQSWVWGRDINSLAPWPRAGMRMLRMLWAIVRDLRSGELNLRAMSLVYTTMLSIVPLLAVSFSVLKGFGVHEALETAMMGALQPLGEQGVNIGRRIIEFVDNVKVGVLGSVGLALLLYTVISLMQKIEVAFNFIWLVPQERPFAQRFSDYLSVIVIGPVMVFSSLGVSASLQSTAIVKTITAIEPFGSLLHFGSALLPYVLVVAAFTFIYVFMPNTRVKLASAFAGAIVAGLLWNLTSILFAKFVVSSAQYTAIYSAFAALIIFMLWLYIGWLVLLAGASVAFYFQNPEQVTLTRGETTLSVRLAERLAFAFLAEITNQFATPDPQTKLEDLASKAGVPAGLAERQIEALAQAGLVIATTDSPKRWMPARAPETISLSEVMAAIRQEGETPALEYSSIAISPIPDRLLSDMQQRQTEILSKLSLADLIDRREVGSSYENSVESLLAGRESGDAAE